MYEKGAKISFFFEMEAKISWQRTESEKDSPRREL